ncbi:MAG TPA: molecular chaperone TorD family protein [Negativicutes bacterium]|jgi:TorA maturation chaperone TorD
MSLHSAKVMQDQGVQILIAVRVFAYDLLRRIFLEEPSKEFLEALVAGRGIEAFPLVEEHAGLREGQRLVLTYLQQHDIRQQQIYDRLHWDYTKLFIGPYELPAPPWESAYLNEERLLFQQETLDVRQAYLKYKLIPREFLQEADDHLGLELDFMYRLCLLSKESWGKQQSDSLLTIFNDQKGFLQDHLLKWIPALTQDIDNNAETAFYKGMARILKAYIELDIEIVEELLLKIK